MNGKGSWLGLSSCSKLNVGAVVVGWKEVGVRPPDNVWTVEVVIALSLSLGGTIFKDQPFGIQGGLILGGRTPGILSGLPVIINRVGMIAFS